MRMSLKWMGMAWVVWATVAHGQPRWEAIEVPHVSGGTMHAVVWSPAETVPGALHPLVVISHGAGGSAWDHRDTAEALATAGFVVMAVAHRGDNFRDHSQTTAILNRPAQLSRALDFMLESGPGHAMIDPHKIGLFGFSSGGFTALVSIGAKPKMQTIQPFCADAIHAGDFVCALLAKQHDPLPTQPVAVNGHDVRIRAAVVVAPALSFTFDRAGLSEVRVPVQLWRGTRDTLLPHPFYAENVKQNLPLAPEYHVVEGAGHFDFMAPCTPELAAAVPAICTSQPPFDRTQFHVTFNREVVDFFSRALQ